MDPTTRAVLAVCMRWIHIASVVTLIGGFIYARFVLTPALGSLAGAEREAVHKRAVQSFRPLLYAALVFLIGSGAYNYLTKGSYPPHYHMWMGIKLLLVLHIVVSAIPYALLNWEEARFRRRELNIAISGLIVIAIAAYLRFLSST